MEMYRYCVKFDTHHKDLIDLFNQYVFTAAHELMRVCTLVFSVALKVIRSFRQYRWMDHDPPNKLKK